ncbi:MAG: tRNA-dihydrouridine synthase family protein [Candidatus Micrarchaeota archaeon]|nr:tRNA-dihydrouridine synthase family protein [Candidatus Micrarchaeota archaeon]
MKIPKKSFLGPIADYTNSCFREMCIIHKADFAVVPLVSSIAICNSKKDMDLDFCNEKNIGIQLFGNDPKLIRLAIRKIGDRYDADWFDLNFGCPAAAITGSGCGSALMANPGKIEEIIRECRKEDIVLSAKSRIFESKEKTIGLYKRMEDAGIDFVTVHGRTPKQGYSGKADWEMIKEVKQSLGIPVIGNGDIGTASEGMEKVKKGHCDAFMVARAAMANPYLFENKEPDPGIEGKRAMFLEYLQICGKKGKKDLNDIRMKALNFFHGFEKSRPMRESLSSAKSMERIMEIAGVG